MELQQEPSAASTPTKTITLGTRRSKLARIQTDLVAAALQAQHTAHHAAHPASTVPPLDIKIHAMDPLGDRDKTTALYKLSDGTAAKSLWTGELEELLAARELDAIVHSLKDMPTSLPEGLVLGAVLSREDARDALVLRRRTPAHESGSGDARTAREILQSLPEGSIIGTSSLRRSAQLRRAFPHLRYEVVRGNVPTRIRKLDHPEEFTSTPTSDQAGPAVEYAALILAAAGLLRLDMGARIDALLAGAAEHGSVLHAVGQGAIGIEARADDAHTLAALRAINHAPTWRAVLAERALLRTLEGGCSVPIGVETCWGTGAADGQGTLLLRAAVVSVDGATAVLAEESAAVASDADAEALGVRVARDLVERGASRVLDAINEERRREREGEELAAAVGQQTSSAAAGGIA